jgi:hypothetical protein
MTVQAVEILQSLRLRAEPSLAAFAPLRLPPNSEVELLGSEPQGWVEVRALADGDLHGWCLRGMLEAARHAPAGRFPAAERRIWALAQAHDGKTGYRRGAKAAALAEEPPVIDCSGWVALLLTEAMRAQNAEAGETLFDVAVFDRPDPWSDRLILEIEARTPLLLEGPEIDATRLPSHATIGLDEGYAAWQANRPRLRGINHIVQLVRRPADGARFVSESYGDASNGVRLTPLDAWLSDWRAEIADGRAWAVDPFAMADPAAAWMLRARGA